MKKILLLALAFLTGCPELPGGLHIDIVQKEGGWFITFAGSSAPSTGGVGGSAGQGGSAAGVSGSTAGASGSAGVGAAGKAGSAGAVVSAGRGGSQAGAGGSAAGAAGSVVVPPFKPGFSVGIQTWFVDPSWTGEKLFTSPGVWDSVSTDTHLSFIDQMKPFSTIRHMDANATNCSDQGTGDKGWDARKKASDATQIAYGAADGHGTGIAYEYQIDMCNLTNNDCWFTVPHLADDMYVSSLAALIKSRLKPTLQVYVEYSNETWNKGTFGTAGCQPLYVEAQGTALNLPGSNVTYKGQAFTVYRLLQIGSIFKATLPATKLVYAFSANYDTADQALKQVYKSSQYNPKSVVIDMLAVAPYIGGTYSLASFKSRVDSYAASAQDGGVHAQKIATTAGISVLGCYETGGQYFGDQSAIYWNASDSGQAYRYMLDKWSTVFNGACNLYTHASEVKPGNAWGLYDNSGKASARAPVVLSWIASH